MHSALSRAARRRRLSRGAGAVRMRGGYPGHPPHPKPGPGSKARRCRNRLAAHGPARAARRASGLTWAASGSPRSARTKAGAQGRSRAPRWRAPGTRPAARPPRPCPPRAGASATSPAGTRPPAADGWRARASQGRPALARVKGPDIASRSPTAPRPHSAARGPSARPAHSHPPGNRGGGRGGARSRIRPAAQVRVRAGPRAGPRPLPPSE